MNPYRTASPPDPEPEEPRRINWDYAWRAAVVVSISVYFLIVPLVSGLIWGVDGVGVAALGIPCAIALVIAVFIVLKFTWQEWVKPNGRLFR